MFDFRPYMHANRIKLQTVDGQIFRGIQAGVVWRSDLEDIVDDPEDEMNLDTNDGRPLVFRASEVVAIEVLDDADISFSEIPTENQPAPAKELTV